MATSIKISQLPAKGSNLEATDLLEVSEFNGTGYVSKSITGAEIVASVPPTSVEWGDIGGTLSAQTDLNTALNGKVPTTRTLTINGTTQDLSVDRTFSISTGITIGTTAITSGTVGRVLFEGTGNVVSESANLFWDNTNGRLGIGTSSPTTIVHINGNTAGTAPSLQIRQQTNTVPTWFAVRNTDTLGSAGAISLDIGISGGANQFFNGTSQGDIILKAYSQGNTSKFFLGATSGSTAQMALFPSTGNVGINTTTDAGFKLDVNGTARVSGNTVVTTWLGVGGVTTPTGSGEKFNVQGAQVISGASGAGNFLLYQISGASRFIVGSEASIGGTANNYINYVYGNNSYITYTNNVARLSVTGGGNVLINTTTDVASSKLTIESTTQGFLPPRMTTTQKNAIATPATGLMVYDTTLNLMALYNGTTWITL